MSPVTSEPHRTFLICTSSMKHAGAKYFLFSSIIISILKTSLFHPQKYPLMISSTIHNYMYKKPGKGSARAGNKRESLRIV